jgi:hypothetical protein
MDFFSDYFSNIWKTLTNKKFYYIILYLLISLITLVSSTKPSFGYDILNLKMIKAFSYLQRSSGIFGFFEKIGLGSNELYFYLGYILIYTILFAYVIYSRINTCIEEYRKRDPKYQNYSAWDFVSNNVSDVLWDASKKTIGSLLPPFIIFIIITIGYLVVNNVSKIAVPLKIVTSIVNYGMAIIVPIVNIWLFIVYFLLIDSAIPC